MFNTPLSEQGIVAFGIRMAVTHYHTSYFTGKDRVFNTPLSEQGIVSFGIGMAVTLTIPLFLQGKTECSIHH